MNNLFMVNPQLIQRLLGSEVSSFEIAQHTGVNQQVVNSFRRYGGHDEPLVPFEEMRLQLAQVLTKEARRQKLPTQGTIFYTSEEIRSALEQINCDAMECQERLGIKPLALKLAQQYCSNEPAFGLIRLGVVLSVMNHQQLRKQA